MNETDERNRFRRLLVREIALHQASLKIWQELDNCDPKVKEDQITVFKAVISALIVFGSKVFGLDFKLAYQSGNGE
jgi:hypothetical protein